VIVVNATSIGDPNLSITLTARDSLVHAFRDWLAPAFADLPPAHGNTLWFPYRVVLVSMLLSWSIELTLTDAFGAVRRTLQRLFPHCKLPRTFSGFSQAIRRQSMELEERLTQHLREQMRLRCGRAWLRDGWCAFAVDGSRFECPRSEANESTLGCAEKKRTAPQLAVTTLWYLGTGQLWSYRVGAGTTSERAQWKDLMNDLPQGSLLLADAGFVGYELMNRLIEQNQSFFIRIGANVQLLTQSGVARVEDSQTVYLWPNDFRSHPPLILRLIAIREGKRTMYLLSNLSEKQMSDEQAYRWYQLRWGVEVFYRTCKQTFEKTKLRSRAPQQAEVEFRWALISIWLLGLWTMEAILKRGGMPGSWSAALAYKRVRDGLRRAEMGNQGRWTLGSQLSSAVQDTYQRWGTKGARDWPHKKKQKGAGKPRIRAWFKKGPF
jgi:hypothetical protein